VTTRKPHTAERAGDSETTTREEGATRSPAGAPRHAADQHAADAPQPSVPAGDPEAPVTPVASVESESVGAPSDPPPTAPSDGPPGAAADGPPGAQADGAEDHERKLEADLEQLTAKAEKADEYLELAQRTRADFENYRKRAARDAAVAQERGITKLAKELLPAVDNLDRAVEAAAQANVSGDGQAAATQDNGTATLVSGIRLVYEDVIAALARAGIERFSPEGERFDPQLHEAVAQVPVEGAESGTVVEVYQRGYRLGDVVIRPARVVVAA
jgi:molecular chaperone GrpE